MKKRINTYAKLLILTLLIISSCTSDNTPEVADIKEPEKTIEPATLETKEAEGVTALKAIIWGKIIDNKGGSVFERGVCYGLTENPTYDGEKAKASVAMGSGDFKVELLNLEANKVYYARAYGVNSKAVGYGNQISFKTSSVASPLVTIKDVTVAGANDIFLDVTLKEEGDLVIEEIGLVFSVSENPTIDDNKIARENVVTDFKQRISNLEPETVYYIKPYAITPNGILYGEETTIRTIKKGNFTYSFNQNGADAATVARIKSAFDTATAYYNNFTSIVKHVTVNYSPGTPTADANFAGNIRMGSNSGYQKAGTAMHEMAHTVGVGQHWKYTELMKGTWQGERTNEILQMMTGDKNAVIKGDAIHFWPYGINGAHEDTGKDMDYIIHALILQGMKTDGLPSN